MQKFLLGLGVGIFIAFSGAVSASAQVLQGGESALQTQQGQAQETRNTQGGTGTTENTQSTYNLFTRGQGAQLKVVSDPQQTTPDATVGPSADLTITPSTTAKRSIITLVLGLAVIWAFCGWLIYRSFKKPKPKKEEPARKPEVVRLSAEPKLAAKAKDKKPKTVKKKRKSRPGRR